MLPTQIVSTVRSEMHQLLRVLLVMIRRGILQLMQLKLVEVGGRCGKLLLLMTILRLIAAVAI